MVGKWGKSLAIRVPMEVARAAGLTAAEEIIAESRRRSLGGVSIRELLDDGRRR